MAMTPADVGDGRSNGDPRTFLWNGQWVDPRTVNSAGMGGVTYAGPADSNGYIAGQGPQNAAPMPMYGNEQTTQANPYLAQTASAPQTQAPAQQGNFANQNWWGDLTNAVTSGVNKNLQERIMPGIRQGMRATGGLGSSSQGILESRAVGDANSAIANALAGNFLQGQSVNNSYNLGQGQLQLGNRNTDLSQTALGANLFTQGANGLGSIGTGLTNLGGQQQQAPWTVLGNANANMTPYTGLGASTTSSSQQGGGLAGLLGGLLSGGSLAKQWGWL
jgi:hypothetical protein